MHLPASHRLLGPTLFTASGLVLGGCGNTSAWTDLHSQHLPGGRQYVLHGSLDANGLCIYDLSWMPAGTMEEDVARDDSHCYLVAEVAPTLPDRGAALPPHRRTRTGR